MSLDKNSFMAGLLTGFKLHRPPKGRRPPVPSERYILTESGDLVITEREVWNGSETRYQPWQRSNPDNDNYPIITWYPNPSNPGWDWSVEISKPSIVSDAVVFFAHITDTSYMGFPDRIVVVTHEDLRTALLPRIYIYNSPTGQGSLTRYNSYAVFETNNTYGQAGDFWWYTRPMYNFPQGEIFTGTESDLVAYLSGIKYWPMLTE